MDCRSIIEEWVKYSDYDPERNKFNLLSTTYQMHRATERMKKIIEFDETYTVAALYAKKVFMDICADTKVSLLNVIASPDSYADDKRMWELFNSEEFVEIEETLLGRINTLIMQLTATEQLGERNIEGERAALLESLESVTEELIRCHVEVFSVGSDPIAPIKYFSTAIHVFNKVSECVTALEQAKDGMYLCFIRNGDTADCWFGFFIKSGANIIAIDERIPEKYPGQHTRNSRNARHSEDKQYRLFPYNQIFTYGDYDYKGVATTQKIDASKVEFMKLGADVYMPLLLAMVLVGNKYAGYKPDPEKCLIIDSLLPLNLLNANIKSEALVPATDSLVVKNHAEWTPNVTEADVFFEDAHEKFRVGSFIRTPYGCTNVSSPNNRFAISTKLFVEMYGADFHPNFFGAFDVEKQLKLMDGKKGYEYSNPMQALPNLEFMGTAADMDTIAWCESRKQLAEHIRDGMFNELRAFGGASAINVWFKKVVEESKDRLIALCCEKALREYADNDRYSTEPKDNLGKIVKMSIAKTPSELEQLSSFHRGYMPFNANPQKINSWGHVSTDYHKYLDMDTGSRCSIMFTIDPEDWKELEFIYGELPRVLTGWIKYGHNGGGNSLLDNTDPVFDVGTPFEAEELRHNPRYIKNYRSWGESAQEEDKTHAFCPRTDFTVSIAFSKRGWANVLKEYREKNGKGI